MQSFILDIWKILKYLYSSNMIKNIVVVGSGKGGVGKSTVSVNLAVSLAKKNLKIGLLDADIYGPSIPKMLGITEKPEVSKNKKILPY